MMKVACSERLVVRYVCKRKELCVKIAWIEKKVQISIKETREIHLFCFFCSNSFFNSSFSFYFFSFFLSQPTPFFFK